MSIDRVIELLRASALLQDVPEDEIQQLASRVRRQKFQSNQLVFHKRDVGDSMMVVASGRVKIVSASESGAEVLLNIVDPGQVFGEMALLDGKERCADAVAARDSEIISLFRRDFLEVLDRIPELSRNLMAILCDRIRQTTSFVESAVFLDVETRLLHALKTLAEQYGEHDASSSKVRIQHGLSQQDIGDSVGLTRVSINRQLANWKDRNLIEFGRGHIVVFDLQGLEAEVRAAHDLN